MHAIIKVGTIIEGEGKGTCTIHVRQEPWGEHKNEEVRVYQTQNRFHVVQVAERLAELLHLNVYYSDHLTVQEFLER